MNSPIKLSVAYAYQIVKYGYPPSAADVERGLREIASLGFRHTELEGFSWKGNREFAANIDHYRKLLDELGMNVHNYCIVDPDLVSMDSERRRRAYELYDIGCDNAAKLGARTVHLATYAPPLTFRRSPYELGAEYNFELDLNPEVPEAFNWADYWSILVESCRQACVVAARSGLLVLVEPRVGEVISSTDSMLRLLDDVAHPALKANFDVAHLAAQKEVLPLSWVKLAGRVGGIHLADNDTRDVEHRPIGQGTVDIAGLLALIARSDYDGYIGLDLFTTADEVDSAFVESRSRLREIVHALGLDDRYQL